MERVHSRCPSQRFPPDFTFTCQRRYHQVQSRSSKEKQPKAERVEMELPVHTTQPEWLITSFLCYASLTYEIRRKPLQAALQAKGQCGHFLPCSETSQLIMVVPSQKLSRYKKSSLPWTVILALAPAESPHLKA